MKKKRNKLDKSFYIFLRYLILLALMFTLPIFYKIITPLTIYPLVYLLKLFFQISLSGDIIIINAKVFVQIIPACIAGSAYLLLLILNFSVPMSYKKRTYSILSSFIIFYLLNMIRLFSLIILYYNNQNLFDFTHKLFWYVFSVVFVIAIWFFIVKIFSIKEIPIYTDLNYFMKNIKKK